MLPKSTKNLEPEVELLERFVKADSETLLYLYKSYLPSITRYVCTNGGNEEDARDVFQEALLVLYKQTKAGSFKLSASLKTYIFSICRFQWLKCMRKNKRIESLAEGIEIIDLNSDAVEILENAEKFVLLQSHLSRLNSTSQQIMDLYFQKYSTQQIADTLGLSRLYVKKRKYELKKELIESIQNDSRYCEMKSID